MQNQPDKLNALLREWQPEPLSTDEVRREVWNRIERLEPSPWASWMALLEGIVWRPLVATSVLAIAMMAGVMLGNAASTSAQTESYFQSVSVFHQPR